MKKLLLVSAICALSSSVFADNIDLIDGSNPEIILEIAKGFGAARLVEDVGGDPMIEGRMEGKRYSIYFYGCSEKKSCDSILLSSSWYQDASVNLDFINEWNRKVRYGMASIDAEGDVSVTLPVNLKGGVTRANLDDTLDIWRSVILRFEAEAQNAQSEEKDK